MHMLTLDLHLKLFKIVAALLELVSTEVLFTFFTAIVKARRRVTHPFALSYDFEGNFT